MILLFIVGTSILILARTPVAVSKRYFSPRSTDTCNITTIISSLTNGILTMNGTQVNTSTVTSSSAELTITCNTGYSLAYGVSRILHCTEWNSAYICHRKCIIQYVGSTTLRPIVIVGTDRNISNNDELLRGETISVTCASNTTTAEQSINKTQHITCDGSLGKYLRVQPCRPTCNTSSLTLTNNTLITPSPVVGVAQKVTLVCQENFKFISVTPAKLKVTDITCDYSSSSNSSSFSSLVISSGDQCYAIPIVKVVASGDRQVQISATVDQTYDRNGPTLEKVLYQIENQTIRTLHNSKSPYNVMKTGWEYTNASIGYGTQLNVTVKLYYSGLTGPPLIGIGTCRTGPPPIKVNDWIVKFTGTSVIELWFISTNISGLKQLYPHLTFRIDLISDVRRQEIKEELVWSVSSKLDRNQLINDKNYEGDTLIIPRGMFLEAQSCTVRVTSLSGKDTGGSANFSSMIGLSAPSLIGIDVSVRSATIRFYHTLLQTSTPWVLILNGTDITYSVSNRANIGLVVLNYLLSSTTYSYTCRLKGSDGSISESFQITFTTSPAFTEDQVKLGLLITVVVAIILLVILLVIFCRTRCITSHTKADKVVCRPASTVYSHKQQQLEDI